ncbi:FecR family protein [Psychroserpens ponticola]|uniref:FecR family protein n=1 Tax=Psychroserpens ponticola TaxID=2932268 RepID=A0ABY7RV85_9FLAO|nr:FecR family protein [Psychroserpens ponticola]WCO00621.1 FecR family protein [Psychroserpens ponticola]
MDKEDLLKKWLNDELTPAEKRVFEQDGDFTFHQTIVDSAKQFKASNFSKPETFKDLESVYQVKKSKTILLDWFKPLLKIASVVVITLGIYFAFFNTNIIVEKTLVGQHTTIELPDHSKVTLNADSEIEYSQVNWSDNRRLNLDGEAYFKVAKGRIFDVVTKQGVVTVVGTEFNVNQRDDYFEVQCYEGVVKVTSGDVSKTLLAGDTYRLLNKEFSQDKVSELSPQWTQNISTFKAIPFKDVIAELQRQYDVKISVEHLDSERLFTGGFMHENIENAIISITQPMGLSYKTNASNDIIIYGDKK